MPRFKIFPFWFLIPVLFIIQFVLVGSPFVVLIRKAYEAFGIKPPNRFARQPDAQVTSFMFGIVIEIILILTLFVYRFIL